MWSATITKADGTHENVLVYEWDEAPLPALKIEDRGRGWKSGGTDYLDGIVTLDTETSKLTHYDESGVEQVDGCWIYQWAMSMAGTIIAGRDASDLITLILKIYHHYGLSKKMRMVVWVHNLAFDASYLLNGLYTAFDGDISLLATGQRRAVKITCGGGLELRCSYKLVNKSLDAWCADTKTAHKKLVGAVDYNRLRTPLTPLTAQDWDYQINDVVCQSECIADVMQNERYRTVPMTSTGFVRRSMRYASMRDKSWREKYMEMLPTAKQYMLMAQAFIGGYTHANSLMLGIWHNVTGYDAASMYPAVLATELYPMGKYVWKHVRTIDALTRLCNDEAMSVIMELSFKGLRLKNPYTTWNPYVPYSKCYNQSVSDDRLLLDNGKVIYIDHATIALCDVDFHWLMRQYTYDWVAIHRVMIAPKKPLPRWFLDTMREWYRAKVQLKGDKSPEGERRYMEAKQHLNAIYGMCATHIVHDVYDYDFVAQDWKVPERVVTEEAIQEEIDNLKRKSSKGFLPYAWGLYTTAYARDRLFRVMDCCKSPLYSDTDSVKGFDWDFEALDKFNWEMRSKSDKAGFTIKDPSGRDRPIGVFELDGEYKRFSAIHAKCYAYEDLNGELHATIAGVTRDNGYPKGDPRRVTKEEELGSIEALEDGKTFEECGGTRAVYKCEEHDVIVNGEAIHSYGGCAILNTTYEIGGTCDLLAMYGLSDPDLPYK